MKISSPTVSDTPAFEPDAPEKVRPGRIQVFSKKTPEAPEKQGNLHEAYQHWSTLKTPENMARVLNVASPVLDSAVSSYTSGDSPLYKTHAKKLAIEAIKRYDPAQGVQLNTWLMNHLKGLTRYQMQSSPVRTPERAAYDFANINRARQEHLDETGREPTETELADRAGLSLKRIAHVRRLAAPVVPEGVAESEETENYLPGVQRDSWADTWAEYVYHDLAPADKRLYDMLVGRNGAKRLGVSQIARSLGVSPSAVSQRAHRISALIEQGREVNR